MSRWLCMALQDKKVGRFERPFFVTHVHEATRAIQQQMKQGQATFAIYPSDYALYLVAEFDSENGEVISASAPQHILELVSLSTPESQVKGG